MSKAKTGGSAFPCTRWVEDTNLGRSLEVAVDGMTLRDYFAGQSLLGIIGNIQGGESVVPTESARIAYRFADAMIQERNK